MSVFQKKADPPGEKVKVSIKLCLRGRHLVTVELNPLEFEEVRSRPLIEAGPLLIQKAPFLRENPDLCAEILSQLKAHTYRVKEG